MSVKKVVVTESSKSPRDKSILETPAGKEDIQVVTMTWFKQALIRTARTYLQTLVGNLTNIGIAGGVAVTAFANLEPEQQAAVKQAWSALEFYQVFLIAASSAIAPAVVALLQNAVEILTKLDSPQTRA